MALSKPLKYASTATYLKSLLTNHSHNEKCNKIFALLFNSQRIDFNTFLMANF